MSTGHQSNVRALAVFTGYLTVNAALVVLLVHSISHAYARFTYPARLHSRRPIITFILLALTSLAVTWYYMISFFQLDYISWQETQLSAFLPQVTDQFFGLSLLGDMQLGAWLKDVELFRDAWETVVEQPTRACWSLPIFYITTGWSFYIAKEAQKRNIRHAWAYMVLGQLVAISFAVNLFFLAVLTHPVTNTKIPVEEQDALDSGEKEGRVSKVKDPASTLWAPPPIAFTIIRDLTFFGIFMTAISAQKPEFLLYLALPHVLLLIPPVLHNVVPRRFGVNNATETFYDYFYRFQIRTVLFVGITSEIVTIGYAWSNMEPKLMHEHRHSNAHEYPWQYEIDHAGENKFECLWRSLLDHPAVASVGWDSILCTTSFVVWRVISR